MKLNLGSGYKKYPGFTNIDADPNCKPDVLLDLDNKELVLPFPDSSVTEIIAEHVLEHIGDGFIRLMQEIYRVSAPGAIIQIAVPHPNHEVYLNDPTHKRPIMVEGMRLFSKKFNRLEIERGGSSSTLGLMYNVDFEIVDFKYEYDPFYNDKFKGMSPEYVERVLREALNTVIEIKLILQVIK